MNFDHAVSHLGKCQGIVNIIRGIPHNSKSGRISIPQDILLKNKISYENIIRNSSEQNVRDAIYEMASRANSHLMKVIRERISFNTIDVCCKCNYYIFQAKQLEKEMDKRFKSICLPIVSLQSYLNKLQKADFNVFDKRLQERNHLLPIKLLWYKMIH